MRIYIKFENNKTIECNQNDKIIEVIKNNDLSSELENIYAALLDDKLVSLQEKIKNNCTLKLVTKNSKEYKFVLLNTAKLVIQLALKKINKKIQISTMNNDKKESLEASASFFIEPRIKKEELVKINNEITKILKENKNLEILNDNLCEYKNDFINFYNNSEYVDFLLKNKNFVNVIKWDKNIFAIEGPFLTNFSELKNIMAFDLTGEYWLGDSDREMLQKIHALVGSEKEIKLQLKELKGREERDHRTIGKKLEIFTINNLLGQGMPIWLPNGTVLKNEIKNYLKEKEFEYDFIHIETPNLGTSELYKISGHWDHYQDVMFKPIELLKETLVMRPMACPHHIQVFKYKPRSYRELPLRFAEHAMMYRYEASGGLVGLERVRSMELTDTHIFAREDQIKQEFEVCYKLITDVLNTFKIKIDYLSLSLRDPSDKEKYFNDDKMWNNAESQLEDVLKNMGVEYKKMIGEAAFYGPKLDIQAKTALGHEITVSTIQLDFLLPQKFNVNYIDKDGKQKRVVMIHRGLIGTYERFIAVLLEQTKGNLPVWCAPIQVAILPISEKFNDYAKILREEFKKHKIRSIVDDRDEKLNYKIRDAQERKIRYTIVVGEKEVNENMLSIREYGKKDSKSLSKSDFINQILKNIESKEF